MQIIEKTSNLVEELQTFDAFQGIESPALQWLIDKAIYCLYPVGDLLFFDGMQVERMQIIIKGSFVTSFDRDGKHREIGVWKSGYVTGILPFSRMKEAKANGKALEDTYVLELHKDHFTEMVQVSYEMVQNLVGVMSTRIREFSQIRFQDEKLMALGKMSAGLAHELNNPASAMVRSAEELYSKIHQSPERFKSVIAMKITPEETDQINTIMYDKIADAASVDLPLLVREERVDDIVDWLEDQGIENAEDIAEAFVDFGFEVTHLEQVAAVLHEDAIEPIMWWFESTLSLERLVKEIQESAARISGLVTSVKNYSHMDRGIAKESVNVLDGIINTLIMMKHKIKKKNIQIKKNYPDDLPKVFAYSGQLNQVWTNTIDNALDAMDKGGTLTIDLFKERQYVCVNISDTGMGIPEETITRIFEPFYTTKPLGEGTGLGLEIVKRIINRHDGEIKVESEVGKGTTFKFCIPIAG